MVNEPPSPSSEASASVAVMVAVKPSLSSLITSRLSTSPGPSSRYEISRETTSLVTTVKVWGPSTRSSSTPVTVTKTPVFQFVLFRVTLSGTVPSPGSLLPRLMVTGKKGWEVRVTRNCAVPPSSVVFPLIGPMITPAESSFCIVPRPWASLMVALTAPVRFTVKFSLSSALVSPVTSMVMVVLEEPAGMVPEPPITPV